MKSLAKLLLLGTLSLLSACTLSPSKPPAAIDTSNNASIENWHLKGKIGIRSPGQSDSAYLNWQQCQQLTAIVLSGPLGQGAARLGIGPHHATLEDSDGKSFHADSAEQLLRQQLQMNIPVSELYFWLRGLPAPDGPYQWEDQQTLLQAGWHIHFDYFQQVDQRQLPAKIIARQDQLTITLILRGWDLNPDCSKTL